MKIGIRDFIESLKVLYLKNSFHMKKHGIVLKPKPFIKAKNKKIIVNIVEKMKTHTKGNVIVEEIKVGDIHYEYEYGIGIKCEVITLPTLNENGQYEWKSRNINNGKVINYLVDPKYSHYSANLYDYEAYKVNTYI